MGFRLLLLPLSALYGGVNALLRKLHESGVLTRRKSRLPVICVGNITVGGTGKTPLIEKLVETLWETRLAVVSRGYGRKTKGMIRATEASTAEEIGDEPSQIKKKYPRVEVIVEGDRNKSIAKIEDEDLAEVVLMDDGHQHYSTSAGMTILVCDYARPVWEDMPMPAGRLREFPGVGMSGAQIVVVNKCPKVLTVGERRRIEDQLWKYTSADVFFARIGYRALRAENEEGKTPTGRAVAVAGIGRPGPFFEAVERLYEEVRRMEYPDHHIYSEAEKAEIVRVARETGSVVVTTEKDYRRLEGLSGVGLLTLPIGIEFFDDTEDLFINKVKSYVNRRD